MTFEKFMNLKEGDKVITHKKHILILKKEIVVL